jgi:peptidoglycan/LPS O-acetylase OafA/YrhL
MLMSVAETDNLNVAPGLQAKNTTPVGSSSKFETGRMSQLDGLRALAALMVIVHHELPHSPVSRMVDVGAAAVWLFFVLSGFLITGILVKSRRTAERSGASRLGVARSFYARRFLRIMPLYYLVVVASFAMNLPGARRYIAWDALYCSNLLRSFVPGVAVAQAHLWSLCVEEQFYLIWPAMILLLPWRWLVAAAWMMVALGPLSRLAFASAIPTAAGSYLSTTSCLDCLGLGALLALRTGSVQRCVAVPLWLGASLLVSCWVMCWFGVGWKAMTTIRPFSYSVVFAWLIGRAAHGFTGAGGRFLACRPLVYLGSISYGLYVYHAAIPAFLGHWRLPWPDRSLARLFMVLVLSITFASVSWFAIERPLNSLKKYFPYLYPTTA